MSGFSRSRWKHCTTCSRKHSPANPERQRRGDATPSLTLRVRQETTMSSPITTDDWLDFEDRWLAPCAMPSRASRGRRHPEPLHPFRSLYQRDRERIVHCTAFRRMTGKTQVLVGSVNDHHRTRLTHTLEVTQLARTVARRLRRNEDLTEAIALAHDLGH